MAFQAYKYEQLDKTKQQIRLLFLHPSERHSVQVQCTIAVVPLEKAPPYYALSYCWGDASIQVAIKLQNHGSALISRLFVTSNLYSALRRIRSKTEYIPLWIDAVCVNQEDNAERGHQVMLMRYIYYRADQTIVWLGESANGSGLAFGLIRAWARAWARAVSAAAAYEDLESSLQQCLFAFKPKMCVGVIKLFERPWWERIWVYQEYVLSKEVIFWCGPDTLNSELFRIAICTWKQFMSDQGKKRPTAELKHTYTDYILKSSNRFRRFDSHRFLRRAEEGRNARQRGYDLLDLIYRTKHLKSTDPRDKIYALLGLDESGDISVSPNYDDSISKVYTDFAIACIEAKGNLEIFYSAGIGHVVQNLPQPSWVPDWRFLSMKGDSLNLFKFDACSNRKKNCFIDPSRSIISVVGIACDAAKATILPEDKQYFRNLQTELNEMAKLALACPQKHPAGISRLQAFFRTTIADDTGPGFGRLEFKGAHEEQEFVDLTTGFMVASGGFRLEQDRQDPTLSEEIERREETSKDNHPHAAHLQSLLDEELAEPTVQTYQENLDPLLASSNPLGKLKWPFRMRRCSHEEESKISVWMDRYTMTFRRSFFITETGYMGLGPPMMEAGDKICIIYGCHIPMVLRKVGDSHLLVGECYVYGMMMGEMIAELEAGKRTEERFHIK